MKKQRIAEDFENVNEVKKPAAMESFKQRRSKRQERINAHKEQATMRPPS